TEALGVEQEVKVVLTLTSRNGQEWPKRLVLGRTLADVLSVAYGDDTDAWAGKDVEVWAENGLYQGKVVPCKMLAPVASAAPAKPPSWSKPATRDDLDDEIPF